MKRIKLILISLLLIALSGCSFTTSSSSSSSNTSNTTQQTTSSSSTKTHEIYGEIPNGVKIYSELEAIEHIKSSNWTKFDEMYVSGIVANVSYNASNEKYNITLENSFKIYYGYLDKNLPSIKVGDEIIAFGKSMIYNSIYELAYDKSHGSYPTIIYIKRKILQADENHIAIDGFIYPIITIDIDDYNVQESGIYNTKEEVSIYIYLFERLPSNYKTKSQFNKNNYTSSNKLSTGGDTFFNKEGRLPSAKNRTFIEADIDYAGGSRNAKRIVYSSDFLIFYTSDHYETFSYMKVIE